MKTKADIIDETTVRVLLDKWYDGTATAADEDALTLYFTTSEDIPEDLRADATVFALPTEKSQSMSEDIPSDLMAQVNGAINNCRKGTQTPPRLLVHRRICRCLRLHCHGPGSVGKK